jgi:WLM domain
MKWYYPWVLFTTTMVLLYVIATLDEPPLLKELKARYLTLRKHLQDTPNIDPRFKVLRDHRPIITGIDNQRMNKGTIGYNVNKGYEIYICLDGENIDAAMHVLIHELAHMTVPEYDHSPEYWASFKDLRQLCISIGIFRPTEGTTQKYCGGEITL